MKLRTYISILLLLALCQSVSARVEKIEYRAWENCYSISNDLVRIIINASSGGRILVYERDGINVLFEDPDQNGKLLSDFYEKKFNPDAGRFDYGPQSVTEPLHNITYLGSWDAEIIDDYTLKITSQDDVRLGVRSERIFSLDAASSQLTITQKMENISDEVINYFFWGRTLVPTDGLLLTSLSTSSKMPGRWGRYIWGRPQRFEIDSLDPGIRLDGDIFVINTASAKHQKYGTDGEAGWMAYAYRNLLFTKRYNYYDELTYGEQFDQINVFYIKKGVFAEMEPVSPAPKLLPGDTYTYTEYWYLEEYNDDDQLDVHKAERFILQLDKPEK